MKDFHINGGESEIQNIVLSPHGKIKPEFIFGPGIKKSSLTAVYSKRGTIIQNKAGKKLNEEYNYSK